MDLDGCCFERFCCCLSYTIRDKIKKGCIALCLPRLSPYGVYLAARAVLRESLRLPGARVAGRLASWTKDANKEDIPELVLNRLLPAEVFLQMLASGLGTVALVWATVVLLGGFSSMLVRMDFWFITAIVFVETARFSKNSSMHGENDNFLVIMKAAAKLATWMMKIDVRYIEYFCQVNIIEKLEDATSSMANLEKYMMLTGGFPDGSGTP